MAGKRKNPPRRKTRSKARKTKIIYRPGGIIQKIRQKRRKSDAKRGIKTYAYVAKMRMRTKIPGTRKWSKWGRAFNSYKETMRARNKSAVIRAVKRTTRGNFGIARNAQRKVVAVKVRQVKGW